MPISDIAGVLLFLGGNRRFMQDYGFEFVCFFDGFFVIKSCLDAFSPALALRAAVSV